MLYFANREACTGSLYRCEDRYDAQCAGALHGDAQPAVPGSSHLPPQELNWSFFTTRLLMSMAGS